MSMRAFLFQGYWTIQRRIAPKLRYSQYFYEEVLKAHLRGQAHWLDVGCGHQLLSPWRHEEERRLMNQCAQLVGIDSDLPSLLGHKTISRKVRGDLQALPFKDGYFDLVTANMVVEHLDKPQQVFQEIRRVLKSGGVFIFHTPNAFGYFAMINRLIPFRLKDSLARLMDGRQKVFAAYYRANTPGEIGRMADFAGFRVRTMNLLVTSAACVVFPPLAIFELLWIRLLMTRCLKPLRTNIIAVLEKDAA